MSRSTLGHRIHLRLHKILQAPNTFEKRCSNENIIGKRKRGSDDQIEIFMQKKKGTN